MGDYCNHIYKHFSFKEFYSIVYNSLNEDVWNIIYKLATPSFNIGALCMYGTEQIKIVNIYYINNHFRNEYGYSYEIKNSIGYLAYESYLTKIKKKTIRK
jgi:hypothetical protein